MGNFYYLCDNRYINNIIMQYWINHNGVQSGPVDLDGLKELGLTSAAYVWHEGMADWVKITQLPELQGLYEMVSEPAVEQRHDVTTGAPIEGAAEQPQGYDSQQPQCGEQPLADEPCPSTNLVWAIVATVLCCVPFGIVAIYYATRVTKCYSAGDIMGAHSASETSQWWSIAAIVLGVVWRPLILSLMCG